ncbi:LysR substrate-binding domain-containing protein [Variovorax sp. 770b2]|uniref:LysR substrate-binding domain-containing protein n=1 Tax=Variovorax sp. 770b2 TaxID=1566271 RepID=UPI000A6D120C|nr:LysR substrate-binding domain-containing protein [Variovorax sp. 770b2]
MLADLEESVGFQLFERSRGRLHPTVEAHTLYEEVNRSLIGVERIARAAHEIRTQQRGALHVAAPPSIALSFMPRAIPHFLKRHRGIQISLGAYDSRTIVDMVIGQRCDVGIVNLSIHNTGTHGGSLLTVAHTCAVPVTHRLASQSVVVPGDIEGELFLAHPNEIGTRLLIDTTFAAHGVKYSWLKWRARSRPRFASSWRRVRASPWSMRSPLWNTKGATCASFHSNLRSPLSSRYSPPCSAHHPNWLTRSLRTCGSSP